MNKMAKTNNLTKQLEWYKDDTEIFSGYGYTDETVYTTDYKGYEITVYPIRKNNEIIGYEYEYIKISEDGHIINEFDSLENANGEYDHAETVEKAQEWAINTVNEIDGGVTS